MSPSIQQMTETKWHCRRCGATDEKEFYSYRSSRCKSCLGEQRKLRYHSSPSQRERQKKWRNEKYKTSTSHKEVEQTRARQWASSRAGRDAFLRRSYGISVDQYESMEILQLGCCAICGTTEVGGHAKRLHVDHCHETGQVRGLLCNGCNLGLGYFREDENALANAVWYLAKANSLTQEVTP
jgi:hypothetical protein